MSTAWAVFARTPKLGHLTRECPWSSLKSRLMALAYCAEHTAPSPCLPSKRPKHDRPWPFSPNWGGPTEENGDHHWAIARLLQRQDFKQVIRCAKPAPEYGERICTHCNVHSSACQVVEPEMFVRKGIRRHHADTRALVQRGETARPIENSTIQNPNNAKNQICHIP